MKQQPLLVLTLVLQILLAPPLLKGFLPPLWGGLGWGLGLGGEVKAQIIFQKAYGGANWEGGSSIQQTTDGGYVIAGATSSFGAGSYDVYLIKTDSSGKTLWSKTYGGANYDVGTSVQQTVDGGYVIAGSTMSFGTGSSDNFYVIKTDTAGDTMWTKAYGGAASDAASSIQQTADGGYIIAGGTQSFGAGILSVYVIKTDASGDTLWTKVYGGNDFDVASSIQQTVDGGYIITGSTWSFGAGSADVYVIKTDVTGDTLWTKVYGGNGYDAASSIQQTADGGYVIAGKTQSFGAGSNDVYIIKTDASGNTLWTRTYGGSGIDAASSIQQTVDGGYVIAGTTRSFGAGGRDVYLIKTDASGDTLWTKTYGGTNDDGGNSVQQTADGGYVIAGVSDSSVILNDDVYIIKTGPNGNTGSCNQYSTNTVITNPLTQVSSGGIMGSGGIVGSTATIVTNQATIDSVLCFSCPLPNPAFTYKITSNGSTIEVNFVDSTTNAEAWFWDFGDGTTDTNQSPTQIYTDSAVYYVCLTVSNSCGSDILCKSVNVWCELPAAGFTSVVSGLTVNFLDTSINATSWFWDFGDGAQSTQQDTSHTYSSPGDYDVCLTVSNDCGFDTLCVSIIVFPFVPGMNEFGASGLKFKIYPNPNRGVFTLSMNYEFNTNIRIVVYDVLGRECLRTRSLFPSGRAGEGLLEIDISTYPSGIYHLQIITDKEIGNKKLIIE